MGIPRVMAAAMCGLAAALAGAAAAHATPSLDVRAAAARVVVIPEARSDVKVEVLVPNRALPLTVRTIGQRVIVDGGLHHRVRECSAMYGKPTVRIAGLGQVSYDNLPQLIARVPMDARVAAGGAVYGSIGRAESVELSNAGCGDWTLANVRGTLRINQAGSGDARAGNAGRLVVRVAGSGDVIAKNVVGPATVEIAGSGDVTAASVIGPLHASVAGSGDVRVDEGNAPEMVVHIAGSGDVRFGGTAGSLEASVAGSGGVNVGRVTGQVRKAVMGSGDVNIGGI